MIISLVYSGSILSQTKNAGAYFYGNVAINQESYSSTSFNYQLNETHQLFAQEKSLEGLNVWLMLCQKALNFAYIDYFQPFDKFVMIIIEFGKIKFGLAKFFSNLQTNPV